MFLSKQPMRVKETHASHAANTLQQKGIVSRGHLKVTHMSGHACWGFLSIRF